MDFVRLDRADTVVTAVKNLAVGMAIEDITVRDAIPSGHKSRHPGNGRRGSGAQIRPDHRLCVM